MKNFIIIGRARLDIDISGDKAQCTPGGPMLSLAADLALITRETAHIVMVSEASLDAAGQLIVDYLDRCGVDTQCIDRYNGDVTPLALNFGAGNVVEYKNSVTENFDTVWPRINAGDIVTFGGRFALEARSRKQLCEMLDYARTRKAQIVYIPHLDSADVPRATRVMPAVLDNIDAADVVIVRPSELQLLFGISDPEDCYNSHLQFHCPRVVVNAPDYTLRLDGHQALRGPATRPADIVAAL